MDNFDDFLRAEIRRLEESRLDEYGNREALKNLVTMKAADLAGTVSNRAKGASNLRSQVQNIVKEFKIYCGEQQIPYSYVALEDFGDFLLTKGGFEGGDGTLDVLVYGKKPGESKFQKTIDTAISVIAQRYKGEDKDDADQADQDQDDADQNKKTLGQRAGDFFKKKKTEAPVTKEELDWFKALHASGSADDKIAVSKALWKLTRTYPTLLRHFSPIAGIIGKKLDAKKLYQVATITAKVMLKSASGKGEDEEADVSKNDLDEGKDVLPKKNPLAANYRSEAFEAIEEAGLKETDFKTFGAAVADSFVTDDPDERERIQNKVLTKLNRFSAQQCIKLTRKMLVFFVWSYDLETDLKELITLMNDQMEGRWEQTVKQAILIMKEGHRDPERKYDATKVNENISKVVRRPDQARQMLAIMIYCLYAKF